MRAWFFQVRGHALMHRMDAALFRVGEARGWRSAVSPLPRPSEGRSGRGKEGARIADRKSTAAVEEASERTSQ